ncbi:hypothetical protein A3A66_02130 [Microgenomates group bacterium RIFCSPLOWO2_01_FULL_46_13]|nr:MAG: hypothetical protein A2783_01900 [Microgenomates group bacterium RIFCSPHIGHO2_01_FULL_45_11]OGV94774.1 MAG: hypothetical protein A3A66_02130 [Microgenomates group bacterium RIFCSPLOWO2_01_FULL_46_13]
MERLSERVIAAIARDVVKNSFLSAKEITDWYQIPPDEADRIVEKLDFWRSIVELETGSGVKIRVLLSTGEVI